MEVPLPPWRLPLVSFSFFRRIRPIAYGLTFRSEDLILFDLWCCRHLRLRRGGGGDFCSYFGRVGLLLLPCWCTTHLFRVFLHLPSWRYDSLIIFMFAFMVNKICNLVRFYHLHFFGWLLIEVDIPVCSALSWLLYGYLHLSSKIILKDFSLHQMIWDFHFIRTNYDPLIAFIQMVFRPCFVCSFSLLAISCLKIFPDFLLLNIVTAIVSSRTKSLVILGLEPFRDSSQVLHRILKIRTFTSAIIAFSPPFCIVRSAPPLALFSRFITGCCDVLAGLALAKSTSCRSLVFVGGLFSLADIRMAVDVLHLGRVRRFRRSVSPVMLRLVLVVLPLVGVAVRMVQMEVFGKGDFSRFLSIGHFVGPFVSFYGCLVTCRPLGFLCNPLSDWYYPPAFVPLGVG